MDFKYTQGRRILMRNYNETSFRSMVDTINSKDVKPKFYFFKSILKLSTVVRYVVSKNIFTLNFVSSSTRTEVTAF